MPNVLMLGAAQKATGDRIRIACDFGNEPAVIAKLIDGSGNYDSGLTAFSAYTVTCPGEDAPEVSSITLVTPYILSALLEGGDAGSWDVVFSVTIDDTDDTELSRTGTLENIG